MTAFASRIAPRESSLRDLGAIWVVITLALAYLEVPVANAPLFATALVLQAALGTVVILWLLPGARASLLLALGPGLILGGALSFAVFQIVGRGVVGAVTSVLLGGLALSRLVRSHGSSRLVASEPTLYLHMLGLAALGMASEFEWLLIAAVGFLLAGVSLGVRSTPTWKVGVLAVVALCAALIVALFYRGEWWWVVTDDYNFFEVLSRHLTLSGPLADWGSLEVTRYHWLSYGWSGLVDYTALNPGPLITLTRVMPFTYSIALGASLLMIAERVGNAQQVGGSMRPNLLVALPAWVVVASFRLDWSGTSTAGVFAVLASVVALLAIVVEMKTRSGQRLTLYVGLLAIVVLTKLPSVISSLSVFVGVEILLRSESLRTQRRKVLVAMIGIGASCLLVFASLPWLSSILGDFSLQVKRLPGSLSHYGSFAFLAKVSLDSAWTVAMVVVSWVVASRQGLIPTRSQSFLLSLTPLVVMGVLLETFVNGAANVSQYFSGPSFFLATLTLLLVARAGCVLEAFGSKRRVVLEYSFGFFAISIWVILIRSTGFLASLNFESVLNALTDWRVLTGLLAAFLIATTKHISPEQLRLSLSIFLLASLTAGLFPNLRQMLNDGLHPTVPSTELIASLGPQDSQAVGAWIRANTTSDSVFATNSLYRDRNAGSYDDDFSLAVWSQREFLVLGPKFFGVSEEAQGEIGASMQFADKPTPEVSVFLRQRGVEWFVVDTDMTKRRSWSPFGEIMFETEKFLVLRLTE